MKLINLFALIGVAILLAGCIQLGKQQATTGTASGVIIKSFSAEIPEVYSGNDIVLSLSIENVGEEEATDVKAKIYGLGDEWGRFDEPSIPSLSKAEPDLKVPGGFHTFTWIQGSPSVPADTSYTVNTRLKYGYTTTAEGRLRVYSQDYLKANTEEARKIMGTSAVEYFKVTKSPVTISFGGVARPLIATAGGGSARIYILLENVGQGSPFLTDERIPEVTVSKIEIKDKDGKNLLQSCTPSAGSTIKVPKVGRQSITCDLNLPSGISVSAPVSVSATLSYNYYVDASTTIRVLKTV